MRDTTPDAPDEPAACGKRSASFGTLLDAFRYGDASPDSGSRAPRAPREPARKRRKRAPGYAPPERYAHLRPVPDALAAGMLVIIVGLNPGVATARAGHSFAGPTNLFWPLMFESRVIPTRRPLLPAADQTLPREWHVGMTNLCSRPTAEQSELSLAEMVEAAAELEQRLRPLRAEVVAFCGKGIWDAVSRNKYGRAPGKEFSFGFQPERVRFGGDSAWPGSRVFVSPSTSGRVAAYSRAQRLEIWSRLGEWLTRRRRELGLRVDEPEE